MNDRTGTEWLVLLVADIDKLVANNRISAALVPTYRAAAAWLEQQVLPRDEAHQVHLTRQELSQYTLLVGLVGTILGALLAGAVVWELCS